MTNCACGCRGIALRTPAEVHNPPGLPEIRRRVGDHAAFFAAMRARLSAPAHAALSGLTVRTADDPAVALLDAWAVAGEVLTFATERIANEGYLRTATEEESLRLLGRLVGYAPRPGVAAAVYLAYTVDRDPAEEDTAVVIPRGSRAQSVPGPGEQPQGFETMEDLPARWSCNDLRVRRRRPARITPEGLAGRDELHLAGTATNLRPGDRLLFLFGPDHGERMPLTVREVTTDPADDLTVVRLRDTPPPSPEGASPGTGRGGGGGDEGDAALRGLGALLAALRRPPSRLPASGRLLARDPERIYAAGSDAAPQLLAALDPRLRDVLYAAWRRTDVTRPSPLTGVRAMRAVAAPFGVNVPPHAIPDGEDRVDGPRNVLALDAVYDGLAPGGWVVITRTRGRVESVGGPRITQLITRIEEAEVVTVTGYGVSAKVTRLTLADDWLDEQDRYLDDIRQTTVHLRDEPLALAGEPIPDDVAGSTLELAGLHEGLHTGRWLIVEGERTDVPGATGVRAAELTMIAAVRQTADPDRPGDPVHTVLALAAPLAYRYRRDSVRVYGNVVPATHGTTREEPVGSGDAGRAGQTFTLFHAPLTWLAADTPDGARSTLEVRVGGVRWHEVPDLAGSGPADRVFTTAAGDAGRTRVTFGDGVHGARLPTGVENVRARYRVGLGAAGNVAEHRVTQLATRPLGVSAVTNPLRAVGGADPDDAREMRRGIPLSVTALDRLVGVPDYADFARSRAGIGRADARRLYDGAREVVHVTVAGAGDTLLTDDAPVVTALRAALTAYGDPDVPVVVAVREAVPLLVALTVQADPDHSFDLLEPRIRRALLDRLGFPARELAQPAHLSEAVAAAQAVPGVDHVEVDVFTGVPGALTPAELERLVDRVRTPQPVVPALPARYEVTRGPAAAGETHAEIAARLGLGVAELRARNPGLPDPVPGDTSVVVFRGIRPAQLVTLTADVPDTLLIKERRP